MRNVRFSGRRGVRGLCVQLCVCPGGVCPEGCLAKGVYTYPPVDRMIDVCENTTFVQLLLRTVNIVPIR